MFLMNCEINLILTWSGTCVIVSIAAVYQGAIFSITESNVYVLVVTLSTHHNAKLLQQLKSSLKKTINWSNSSQKYQQKHETSI